MTKKITEDQAGCWLDGHYGWTNHYRVIDLASEYGLTLPAEDLAIVTSYQNDRGLGNDDAAEAMIGQGGLVDQATAYLDSLAPDGMAFHWDAGELFLLCLCQIEGTEENQALMKTGAYQCARCEERNNR